MSSQMDDSHRFPAQPGGDEGVGAEHHGGRHEGDGLSTGDTKASATGAPSVDTKASKTDDSHHYSIEEQGGDEGVGAEHHGARH